VLLAVLAFVGIVILLQGDREPPPEAIQVTVMVAKEDIGIGDPVTPDMVEPAQVNADAVVQTRIGDPSELTGRPAVVNIVAQSQVTREMVGLAATGIPPISLEPGEKAIAFQVDRVTGLDFLIQVGDRIDIILAEQLQVLQPTADTANLPRDQQRFEVVAGLENARTVKTILQNKRVLYVSATRVRPVTTGTPSASPAQGQQAAAQQIENVIIIFAGTDQDAEAIKFAQNDLGELGALTAVLRSTEDSEVERTTGITIDRLVERYGIPIPGIISDLGRNRNR
jgi:pilus assembly protein CpaB